jgi:hypothetical protein
MNTTIPRQHKDTTLIGVFCAVRVGMLEAEHVRTCVITFWCLSKSYAHNNNCKNLLKKKEKANKEKKRK